MSSSSTPNRWIIAIAAILLEMTTGTYYDWSVYLRPAARLYHASVGDTNLTFTITILTIGIVAGIGGYLMERFGPRVIATVAAISYGSGIILAGFAPNLFALYLTYGVLAGIGLSLAFIVPLAMLVEWFPIKRGLISGLAIAGAGLGATLTAPLAAQLITSLGLRNTFVSLGIVYLVIAVIAAQFFRRVPEGYMPASIESSARIQTLRATRNYTFREALSSPVWYLLWLMFALLTIAGTALVSVAAPLTQKLTGVDVVTASFAVSIFALGNSLGRLFWGWLSDIIGRPFAYLALFVIEAISFFALTQISAFAFFLIPVALISLCNGGGTSVMPPFTADFFGAKNAGKIFGTMLTALSVGNIIGPQLISRVDYKMAMYIFVVMLVVSIPLPLIARILLHRQQQSHEAVVAALE